MKRLFALLALPLIYLATVAVGSVVSPWSCITNANTAATTVMFRMNEAKEGSDARYAARRVWPRPDEWLPFQSTYIVSRNGDDYARVTVQTFPWKMRKIYTEVTHTFPPFVEVNRRYLAAINRH